MSLLLAGTLIKAITLHTWTDLGFFALIFCVRTLIKFTLHSESARLSA